MRNVSLARRPSDQPSHISPIKPNETPLSVSPVCLVGVYPNEQRRRLSADSCRPVNPDTAGALRKPAGRPCARSCRSGERLEGVREAAPFVHVLQQVLDPHPRVAGLKRSRS
jgi:hypothetical protein